MNNKRVKDVVTKVAVCAVAVGILVGGGYFSRTIVGQGTDQVATVLNHGWVEFENDARQVNVNTLVGGAGTVAPTVNAQETDRKIKGNVAIDGDIVNNRYPCRGSVYGIGTGNEKVASTLYFFGKIGPSFVNAEHRVWVGSEFNRISDVDAAENN